MRRTCLVFLLSFTVMPGTAAVSDKPDTPFKLATFEAQGKTRVGMLLGDRMLDLSGADAYVTKQAGLGAAKLPAEMRELIEQYGAASKRLYQIANYLKDKRSEEHTSELQSPYVISYAVFCLKK